MWLRSRAFTKRRGSKPVDRLTRHTRERLAILWEAARIYLEEIELAGLYDAIWQAFAVLLPVRTVGVMGDARSYDFVRAP